MGIFFYSEKRKEKMPPKGQGIVSSLFLFLMVAQTCAEKGALFLSDDRINRINSAQSSWKAGKNYHPNSEENLIKLLGELDPKNLHETDKLPLKTYDPAWPSDKEIPKMFDARKKWSKICPQISEIQDQGYCGSCWAVSSMSAASDRLCISSKGKFQGLLSAQYTAFCCKACGLGCHGGFPTMAWDFLKKGVVTGGHFNSSQGCQPYSIQPCMHHSEEESNPYPRCETLPEEQPTCQKKCSNHQYGKSFRKDKHRFESAYELPMDVKMIQKDIMTYGPVTFRLQVFDDFFHYKSGVYERTTTYCRGLHAVRALGWGTENGKPYWLIANSWNSYWGDKGLFKILRGENNCGIEEEAAGGVPRKWKQIEN
nr:PREDICTED: cathepsin B-like isoform X2 [Bemisia tabaci]